MLLKADDWNFPQLHQHNKAAAKLIKYYLPDDIFLQLFRAHDLKLNVGFDDH